MFSVFSLSLFGQSSVQINVITTDMATKKKESGVTMTVYNGSSIVKTEVSPKNGNIDVMIPAGPTYKVVFKKAGKVSRFFMLNSSGIDPELIQGSEAPFVYGEISMFDAVPGADFSYVENTPFTTFKFDGKSARLAFDQAAASRMSQKIDQLLTSAERQSQNNEVQYQAKMKEGEALASQNKYQDAITKFEQALMFKKADKIAIKRIDDMDKLLTANQVDVVNGTALQDGFDVLKQQAEALKAKKQYQAAIDKYEEALTKKRGDQYCLDEIERLEKVIKAEKEARENEAKYQTSMTLGNQMFNQKSYPTALKYFIEALDAKPNDPTATQKKSQIEKLLEDQKQMAAKKTKYNQLIGEADELYNNKNWEQSKAKYQEALAIENASTYAQGRIKDLDLKIVEAQKEKEKQAQIASLITSGNSLFSQSKWEESKAKFLAVQQLDAVNETAKTQIAAIDAKLAQIKSDVEAQKKFTDLVAAGDKAFGLKDFASALTHYQDALEVKKDPAVTLKVENVQKELTKLANAAEKKKKYEETIKVADAFLIQNDLLNAKTKYQEALQIDNTQQYPKDKIISIDKQLQQQALLAETEKQFNDLIAQAQTAFDTQKYDVAKSKYQQAQLLKPTSSIPEKKIQEIDAILKQNEVKQQVESLLADGDKKINAKDFSGAIETYKKVLKLDPKNERAFTQIAASEKAILDKKKQEEDILAQKEQEEAKAKRAADYAAGIKQGDELKSQSKYKESITAYEAAKAFTDDPKEINDKISAINNLIAEAQKLAANKALHERYLMAFNKGVDLQSNEKYQEAINAFKTAKNIDPSQVDPDTKIAEIQKVVDELAARQNSARKVESLLATGDEMVKSAKYADAIAKYNEAKTLDAGNTSIVDKIKNAEELQKQSIMAQSQKEKHDNYLKAFQQGMDNMGAEKYQEAILSFKKAQAFEPENQEPKQKIDQLNKLMAQLLAQKQEAEVTKTYNDKIQQGELAISTKKWEDALNAFQKASNIKPSEVYPKKKIEEVKGQIELEKLQQSNLEKEAAYSLSLKNGDDNFQLQKYDLALNDYQKAQKIKNTKEVQDKILQTEKAIQNNSKQLAKEQAQKEYDKWIQEARTSESKNDLKTALQNYTYASSLKPEESEPKAKIAELNQRLALAASQAEKDQKYSLSMKIGDDSFNAGNFNDAIKSYKEALTYKEVQEAKDKIKTAEAKLAEITRKDEDVQFEKMLQFAKQKVAEKDYTKALELIERAQANRPNDQRLIDLKQQVNDAVAKDKNYDALIAKADQFFTDKEYEKALESYKSAQRIRPTEIYPMNQISIVNGLMAKNQNEKANKQQYQSLLSKARSQQKSGDLKEALSTANSAMNLLPNEQEAKDLMNELQLLILAKNKQTSDAQLTAQYEKELAIADNLFEGKKWTQAKSAYEKARAIKPQEPYVNAQIKRCSELLATEDMNRSRYLAVISTADNDFKMMNYERAKSGYELALTYDGTQQYPKDKIAEINRLSNQVSIGSGNELQPLGEGVDMTMSEASALLAQAEEYRRNSKGQIIKVAKNQSVDRKDSVTQVREDYVNQNLDSFKLSKNILRKDLSDYYDNQFDINKKVKTVDNNQTDLIKQWSDFAYTDNSENRRKFGWINNIKVAQDRAYVDHNFDLVDSVRMVRGDLYQDIVLNTLSDYDLIMDAKKIIKGTEENQIENNLDDYDDHLKVVDLAKNQREIAVQEYKQQQVGQHNRIDEATDKIQATDDKDIERKDFFTDNNHQLADKVVVARSEIIDKENENFNEVYTKQLKAKGQVTNAQNLVASTNEGYSENKSLDIDKSRVRLNEANNKYNGDANNDARLREEAKSLINSTSDIVANRNVLERKKSEVNTDKVNNISNRETTLQKAKTADRKESIYDTRTELKTMATSKVQYPAKIANQIGKDYPEGVTQEVFKQNGSDGLPIAIITRRIVVINGFGNVYTRTQKYGSITYSKNGDPCLEMIWTNETTDPKLNKN